jgi:hypothetical protein
MNYYYFNRTLTRASAGFAAGNFYKSAQLKARIDYPNRGRFYLEPTATFNSWDYLEGNDLVVTNESPTVLTRIDRKVGAALGVPMGRNYKLSIDGILH